MPHFDFSTELICLQLAFLQLGGALAVGIETKQAGLFSHFWSTKSTISTGVGAFMMPSLPKY